MTCACKPPEPVDCSQLEADLEESWHPFNPLEWPRVMRRPIPAQYGTHWRDDARHCMNTKIAELDPHSGHLGHRDQLLMSVLLQDEAQRRRLKEWVPARIVPPPGY